MTKSNLVIKQGLRKAAKPFKQYEYNNERPEKRPLEFDVADISKIRLLSTNNMLLCKPLTDNRNAKSAAGLYLVGDTDFKPSEHVDRVFEVVAVPSGLYYKDNWFEGTRFKTDERSMEWKTDMEVEVGDTVWCEYLEAIEAPVVLCKGVKYRLLKYERLFLAQRVVKSTLSYEYGDIGTKVRVETELVPLNGYCLYTELYEKHDGVIVVNPTKDSKRIKLEVVGKPNYEYRCRSDKGQRRTDAAEVKNGDVVVINTPHRIKLEGDTHRLLDKEYYVIQRHNMQSVVND